MLNCRALTTTRNSKRSLRCNVQNKTKLVLELFGELTASESVENGANGTALLRLRQSAVLEASRHHRSRSAMPEAKRLRLDERNALLHCCGIIREQTVAQRVQFHFVERLETVSLGLHHGGRRGLTGNNHFGLLISVG